jgi:hypothetical protein
LLTRVFLFIVSLFCSFLSSKVRSISSVIISLNKKFIVTSEIGRESSVTVWDIGSGQALKSLRPQFENGILALNINKNSQIVFMLSNPLNFPLTTPCRPLVPPSPDYTLSPRSSEPKMGKLQEFLAWLWTLDSDDTTLSTSKVFDSTAFHVC